MLNCITRMIWGGRIGQPGSRWIFTGWSGSRTRWCPWCGGCPVGALDVGAVTTGGEEPNTQTATANTATSPSTTAPAIQAVRHDGSRRGSPC